MPTAYNPKTVLVSESPNRALCTEFADLIEEAVRFGSHVLEWWTEEDHTDAQEKLTTLAFLRNTVDLLDGMHDNMRNERVEALKGPLRSILETYFCMKYLVRADTSRRSRAYLFMHDLHALDKFQRELPSHQDYKKLQSARFEDTILNPDRKSLEEDPELLKFHQSKVTEFEKGLNDPSLKDVKTEFERLVSIKRKPRHWYSFFDGPNDVERLAEHVNGSGLYERFYRRYSRRVHPEDLLRHSIRGISSNGSIQLNPLRSINNRLSVSEISIACQFAYETYQSYIDKFIPARSNQVKEWYQKEIKSRYFEIKKKYGV